MLSELTDMLRQHIKRYGTTREGYLFRGARGGRLGSTVNNNAWANAREKAFTAEVFASPLAKRPYDLRHACLSTWLNAGVEPTRVAQWAGNSLRVLLHTTPSASTAASRLRSTGSRRYSYPGLTATTQPESRRDIEQDPP
jgi:integrase